MQVLTWSSWSQYAISGCCQTYTATLDLGTGIVTQAFVTATHHDMFCPGEAYGIHATYSRTL